MLTTISSRSRLFAALFLTCLFAPLALASPATLDDYQHRVAAAALVDELRDR
jgi:hypothetical protein